MPASTTAESLVSTVEWVNKSLKPIRHVDDKSNLALAITGLLLRLTRINEVHAVGLRAFGDADNRPYLSFTFFADLDRANPEPFRNTLAAQHELGLKIVDGVTYGSRYRSLKSEQVDDVLTKFITPIKREQGKVLGAVRFQRS